jgi:hypothetical protein
MAPTASEVLDLPPLGAATACIRSVPYLDQSVDTGLERCEDGRLHRPSSSLALRSYREAALLTALPPE